MTTITITNINQLRAGDIATFSSFGGHEFSGEVWENKRGDLLIGPAVVRYFDATPSPSATLISATRTLSDLPSKPGSVIANVVTRDGCHYDWAMLAGPEDSAELWWVATTSVRYDWVRPDQITSWDACTVEVQS